MGNEKIKKKEEFKPFGHLHIPPLSKENLSASFEAADWSELREYWNILTYLTYPESDEPIEKTSVNLDL